MIDKALIWVEKSLKSMLGSSKNLARAKAVATLANSEGCILNGPIPYQLVCPLTVFPKKNKPSNKSSALIYISPEYFSYILASKTNRKRIINRLEAIKISCLPYSAEKSNSVIPSTGEETEKMLTHPITTNTIYNNTVIQSILAEVDKFFILVFYNVDFRLRVLFLETFLNQSF